MTIVLLAIGLLAIAAGFVTIGFGIPINAFSLGNTLIISGTISVATGLILIGIAIAVGQLKRIAEALKTRGGRPETVESMAPPTARMTPPAAEPSAAPVRPSSQAQPELSLQDLYPPAPRTPEPPQPEPRFPAPPSEPPAAAPGPLDWLRAKSKPATQGSAPSMPPQSAPFPPMAAPPLPPMTEPPMAPDDGPLSPRASLRPAPPPMNEPAIEPRVWPSDRGASSAEPRPALRVEQPMPRATPQPEPPKEKFDLVWPDRVPPPSPPAPGPNEASRPPVADMPLPPIPARPRDNRQAERRSDVSPPKPPSERGPAILKSGVIDGMPYTLYADGSIEAELPKGTVKFSSVDALRAHLEKSG